MKRWFAVCSIFLAAQAAMALPFSPNRQKTSVSLVFLESEINDVLQKMAAKHFLGLTVPTVFNWNRMIDEIIVARAASEEGCSIDCGTLMQLKVPGSPDMPMPLYFRVKSIAFDFRADGRIFLDAAIGVFVKDELGSFSIHMETAPHLSVGSALRLTTAPIPGKPIGTTAFQTAKLSLCLDPVATEAKFTDFTLGYGNAFVDEKLMEMAQERLDETVEAMSGECFPVTEGLLPPRSAFAKGQRMEVPVVKVSDGMLEIRTKLIAPKDALPGAIQLLLSE